MWQELYILSITLAGHPLLDLFNLTLLTNYVRTKIATYTYVSTGQGSITAHAFIVASCIFLVSTSNNPVQTFDMGCNVVSTGTRIFSSDASSTPCQQAAHIGKIEHIPYSSLIVSPDYVKPDSIACCWKFAS